MHKGVILLTKATSKDEAASNVESFLELYGDGNVWDWYVIGGRWNNTLAPKDKLDLFREKCKSILKENEHGWISQQQVDDNQELLQEAWKECGLKGSNSYCNHYNLPEKGNVYDIIPLKDCLEVVKDWCKDLTKEKKELWDKLLKAKEDADKGEHDSTAYYAGLYRNAAYEEFCFETNVFNITTEEAEVIPEDVKGYYAVMVDMHN